MESQYRPMSLKTTELQCKKQWRICHNKFTSDANGVYLARRAVYLTPGQLKVVPVNITSCKGDSGVLTPTGNMANVLCDFQDAVVRQQNYS